LKEKLSQLCVVLEGKYEILLMKNFKNSFVFNATLNN